MKKVTLNALVELVNTVVVDETEKKPLLDELNAEIERLEKKSAYVSPKDKEKAEKNEQLYNDILGFITDADAPLSVTEIRDGIDPNLSAQKITSILNRLIADNKVVRTYDKRKSSYTLFVE
jgi:hypothetical protein